MHVKAFGTIISFIYLVLSTIAKLFCYSVEWFAAMVCDCPSTDGFSFSSCPMTNLHSAAFWGFLPCCSFGPICFFSLPSANPEPDNHQASCHSSGLWNARKIARPWEFCGTNVLLWLSLMRCHTPLLIFISVAVICNLSRSSHEKHESLEKLKDSFGSEAQAATGASRRWLFMLLKPSCERCCSNQDQNKHTINLFAYQFSREPECQQSCPCSLISYLEQTRELEKKKSLKL